MSEKINAYGEAEVVAAASDILTAYSLDNGKVYTRPIGGRFWELLSIIIGGTEYASSALAAAAEVKFEAGGREMFYEVGAAAAITDRRGLRSQPTPGVLNATGALTAAMMLSGIVTSTTGAAVTATLPTGAVMDAALDNMKIGESFDWSVIVTGGNAFTVTAAASGHTVVGLMAVATTVSATFRTRKTAAATYVTYAVSNAAS